MAVVGVVETHGSSVKLASIERTYKAGTQIYFQVLQEVNSKEICTVLAKDFCRASITRARLHLVAGAFYFYFSSPFSSGFFLLFPFFLVVLLALTFSH